MSELRSLNTPFVTPKTGVTTLWRGDLIITVVGAARVMDFHERAVTDIRGDGRPLRREQRR